jgi:hypothetical protein
VLWTKYYGRPEEDGGNNIIRTSDGGFLIAGHTAFTYGVSCDGYLVKTDADGNLLWYALVGTAYDDVCDAAIELEDGSFLVTGRVENAATRTFRVLLAKISPEGKQIFLKELSTDYPSLGFKIARAADGNLFIAGYSYHPGQSNSDMLALKCTPEGAVIWQKHFGTDKDDRAWSLVPTPDGGCVVVGGTADASGNSVFMLVCRFDASGSMTASSIGAARPGTGYLCDILQTSDGQLVVAGVLHQSATAPAKAVIGILGEDLDVHEWREANFPAACRTRGLVQGSDGAIVICGNTYPDGDMPDIFIAKMTLFNTSLSAKDISTEPYLLFPNPFSDYAYLNIGEPFQTKIFTISTLDGKELRKSVFDTAELFIYRENLLSGHYVFSVRDGAGKLLVSGKLAVE